MKKSKFPYFLGFAAFATASVAAYFSVTGLGKLFAGAAISIMIMASVLEFAKLVVASYIYRYWKEVKVIEKTYLIIALSILMTITSAGIYGYLSGAYSETSSKLQISQGEISLLDKKKEQFKTKILNTQNNIDKKNSRITSLNGLRISQETRLDSLYARKYYKQAKIVEEQIKSADLEIKLLTKETDSLLNIVNGYNEEISKFDFDVTDKQAKNLKGEAAPLQYIANLFNSTMDKVVNFFMFLLIFVCDPLAIVLVIATNKVILLSWSENKTEEKEPINKLFELKKPKIFNKKEEDNKEENKDLMTYISSDLGEFKPIENNPISLVQENEIKETQEQQVEEFSNIEEIVILPSQEDKEAIQKIKDLSIEMENEKYPAFLDIFYNYGAKNIGDDTPVFREFCENIKKANIDFEEREVKNFLTICLVFKLINIKKQEGNFLKDYNTAKNKILFLKKN